MDSPHNLPPVSTGQSSQSQVQEPPPSGKPAAQERPSSLVQEQPSSQPRVEERSASGGSADSGDPRPLSLMTDVRKPLLEGSEGSPSRSRNEPNVGFESHIPAPPRSTDVRRPSRRSMLSRPVSTPGLDWIVPVDEKPRVCIASHSVCCLRSDLDHTAPHDRRAARPDYRQCGRGEDQIRHKRLVGTRTRAMQFISSLPRCRGTF